MSWEPQLYLGGRSWLAGQVSKDNERAAAGVRPTYALLKKSHSRFRYAFAPQAYGQGSWRTRLTRGYHFNALTQKFCVTVVSFFTSFCSVLDPASQGAGTIVSLRHEEADKRGHLCNCTACDGTQNLSCWCRVACHLGVHSQYNFDQMARALTADDLSLPLLQGTGQRYCQKHVATEQEALDEAVRRRLEIAEHFALPKYVDNLAGNASYLPFDSTHQL